MFSIILYKELNAIFYIKKTFYDIWDNLIGIILLNIGIIIITCIILIIPFTIQMPPVFLTLYLILGIIIINFYLGATFRYTKDIADYKKGSIRIFLRYLIKSWKDSMVSALIMLMLLIVLLYVLPYYLFSDSIIDLVVGIIIFWTWFTFLLASLYFLTTCFRLEKNIRFTISSCFSLLFDNTGFSFFILLIIIIILSISAFLIFLLPGISTISLWLNVGLKIRLYKYDYLKANPGVDRKNIPWDKLIDKEKKTVGTRTIRQLIFPWK